MSTATSKPVKAKQPADRKPKAVKPKITEVDGTFTIVHRGVTAQIVGEALDDYDLLIALSEVEKGNIIHLDACMRGFFGDTAAAVTDGLRNSDTGRVKASDVTHFLYEVLQELNPN